jgi:hypothetical protein
MPIQRIPRYVMLLEKLCTLTPHSHPDYAALTQAVKSFKELASVLNAKKKQLESYHELLKIYNLLEPRVTDLIQPHRKKIKEGEVLLCKSPKDGKQLKPRYLYLFNDILLVTKQEDGIHWARVHITLISTKVEPYILGGKGELIFYFFEKNK